MSELYWAFPLPKPDAARIAELEAELAKAHSLADDLFHRTRDLEIIKARLEARIAELEAIDKPARQDRFATSTPPLTPTEHARLARLCVRVGVDKPWYILNSDLRSQFIAAARQYLPHLLALAPPNNVAQAVKPARLA